MVAGIIMLCISGVIVLVTGTAIVWYEGWWRS